MLGVYIGAGLCNRIFQMVFAYSFAKKHGLRFRLESWNVRSHHSAQVYEWLVQRFMEAPNYEHSPVSYEMEYKEPGHRFTQCIDILSQIPQVFSQNILVSGFFQNEHYFLEYEEDIRHLLQEPAYITQMIQEHFSPISALWDHAYFLHIRLGDYVYLEKHWIHLERYYLRALQEVYAREPNAHILLFCNEPENISRTYGKVLEFLEGKRYNILLHPDEVLHLYLMARCKKGGICANSTFGWWASWLNTNPEKKVYMPSRWIHEIPPEEIHIYPSWATLIDVDET